MSGPRFGTAGNSDAFYEAGYKHTYEAPAWLSGQGLDAFEYSFGRGARLRRETGEKIAGEAQRHGIAMSVHAPYYINLANDQFEKNLQYFIESSMGARYLGAKRVVFHPGGKGKMERGEAYAKVKQNLERIMRELKQNGFTDLIYCPETMGKINQIGDLQEVIGLVCMDEQLYPAIDFGHMNARTLGGIKGREDYANILDALKNSVGQEKYYAMHVHFSQIEYTKMGEKGHLTFEDKTWGPFFEPLAAEIKARGLSPVIICESKGTQAKDAATMKRIYEAVQQ